MGGESGLVDIGETLRGPKKVGAGILDFSAAGLELANGDGCHAGDLIGEMSGEGEGPRWTSMAALRLWRLVLSLWSLLL